MRTYLYHDGESFERVAQTSKGYHYKVYGTGTIEERKASPDDVQRYAGKSALSVGDRFLVRFCLNGEETPSNVLN